MRITSTGIELPVNPAPPRIMHIDLNSAFAMTEQQARPNLRGVPVGITNRLYLPHSSTVAPWSICITSSYEAKRQGIRIGTRHDEALTIDPSFVMLESNPARYIAAHRKLISIFQDYSPRAYMKSIDEGVIDFSGMDELLKIQGKTLLGIGREIKQRVREEVGDYMTVNVGIGQNRWLAKVAAGLHKPDGLDQIDKSNLLQTLSAIPLMELPYVKHGIYARLYRAQIYDTSQFLAAPYWKLFREVFRSVMGHHWYLKLRGYETEDFDSTTKTAGRSYVLETRTANPDDILSLLYLGAIKVSRKLFLKGLYARGLSIGFRYASQAGYGGGTTRWYDKKLWEAAVRRPDQLYERAAYLFKKSPSNQTVVSYQITSYGLQYRPHPQLTLLPDPKARLDLLYAAMDDLFDRYGELSLIPASVVRTKTINPMKDKIPFYSTAYFDVVGAR